jgi:hypothetical protein
MNSNPEVSSWHIPDEPISFENGRSLVLSGHVIGMLGMTRLTLSRTPLMGAAWTGDER